MRKDLSVIFDIDGTLIDSFKRAGTIYKNAILEVIPDAQIKAQWKEYRQVTDTGIILEVLEEHDLPQAETIRRIKQVFMREITSALTAAPCAEITGGRAFLARCAAQYKVGIATGCWQESGEVKLGTAGYEHGDLYMSSSDDFDTREEILENCLKRIGGDPERVVYLGDAEWDVRTTETLGWKFIGIGEKLKGKCPLWFPDYSEPEEIIKALE